MSKKKVLVCGATGFIGRNTAEHLANREDFEVYGTYLNSKPFDNPDIEMVKADLVDRDQAYKVVEGKDIIIQAAAISTGAKDVIENPYIHVTDNVRINSLVFEAAHVNGESHVLFPSCTVMYQSSDKPIREEDFDPREGMAPRYAGGGDMKVFSEKLCEFYAGLGDTKFTAFRHSNIYGTHDKMGLKNLERSHVFAATITKVMEAKEGDSILVWGTGEEERDLLYVSDLTSFVEKAIDNQSTGFELVNVGLGESISVSGLVKKIIDISGKNLEIEYDPSKPTIPTKVALECTKAKDRFGWSPQHTLDEGIQKTIDWYVKNRKSFGS